MLIISADYTKAKSMLLKAERMHSTDTTIQLLKRIERLNNDYNQDEYMLK